MGTQQIFHKPTEKDLFIPGMAHQLAVQERVFPIAYLVQFFKVNGEVDKNYFVQRPKTQKNETV